MYTAQNRNCKVKFELSTLAWNNILENTLLQQTAFDKNLKQAQREKNRNTFCFNFAYVLMIQKWQQQHNVLK